MSDELPPAPSESTDDASKAETIRITLPAKPETPTTKRETVRINLPGKSAITAPPPVGVTPKKETTKLGGGSGVQAAPPPTGAKPFVPPPRPPGSAPGAPQPPQRPVSGMNPPPKPPTLGKPTVPLKPAPMPSASGIRPAPGAPAPTVVQQQPAPEPMTQKAAAPKKETARITLPPEGTKAAMPKATVKMQQTQPLVKQPMASGIQTAPATMSSPMSMSASSAPDGAMNILAIAAFIVSLGAAALAFLSYSSASL